MEGRLISRYNLLEKLGEGGMGVVYKARDPRLDRFVALKFLPARRVESADARDRFHQEARAVAALNHPNIETIYEVIESEGAPVLVLEYLPGGTLRSRIRRQPLTPAENVRYALQVAEALSYAHRRGLIHRDVKTENLMFAEDGRLKITDFGLARFDDGRTVTLDGRVSGTLRCMAPECLQGFPADHLSDIYSFGVALGEMAGGEPMPEALEAIVRRATARDRTHRYRSMEELATDLRRLAGNPAAEALSQGNAPTILVVEDEDDLRNAIEISLSREGYRVLKAGDGREGVRAAMEGHPDIVLLDVMMPGLNGLDACRELRRRGFDAPIIMVTGKTEEIDRVVGLEIGADDYLTKPYSLRELVARIRAHLRRACAAPAAYTTHSLHRAGLAAEAPCA